MSDPSGRQRRRSVSSVLLSTRSARTWMSHRPCLCSVMQRFTEEEEVVSTDGERCWLLSVTVTYNDCRVVTRDILLPQPPPPQPSLQTLVESPSISLPAADYGKCGEESREAEAPSETSQIRLSTFPNWLIILNLKTWKSCTVFGTFLGSSKRIHDYI